MSLLKALIIRKKWELIRWCIKKLIRQREWPALIHVFYDEFRNEYSEENHASSLATINETLTERLNTHG